MTSIDDLKREKELLYKERGEILERQKKMIKEVRERITKDLDLVNQKVKIIDNQIKHSRQPAVAKNLRAIKSAIRI